MGQPVIGAQPANITLASQVPEFRLGTIAGVDDPVLGYREFVYGKAAGSITGLGYLCSETSGFIFTAIDTTQTTPGTAGPGTRVGAAQAALSANQFGWFQIYGKGSLRTLASCAKGTQLNTTGTAGAIDDDATAGSEVINGLVLMTSTGGAAATNADAMFSYPSVGRTL